MLKSSHKNCFVFILSLGCCFALSAVENRDQSSKIIVEQEPEPYAYLKNLSAEQKQVLQEKAESGDAQSQFLLAEYYGYREELREALHWLEKPALQGDPTAQLNLGMAYYLGGLFGVAKDDKKGLVWLEKAALQGNSDAQCYLGHYKEGRGVADVEKKAFDWTEKAALQGDMQAQQILNALYFEKWTLSYGKR